MPSDGQTDPRARPGLDPETTQMELLDREGRRNGGGPHFLRSIWDGDGPEAGQAGDGPSSEQAGAGMEEKGGPRGGKLPGLYPRERAKEQVVAIADVE